ncbi:MAG: hypothetical protein HGB12_06765, partial [Bacteroidetes bacterium]|nr:hypothetical protein [Bacteroidota bacterium]
EVKTFPVPGLPPVIFILPFISSLAPGVDLALMPGGSGNVGIGTSSPGAKLEINGNIKITGGNPGTGKVLTSDVNGLASWGSGTSDFSGTGSDGTLNVLSGTTTLNDASHISGDFAIYNYTTGNISAGAILTTGANFANKILVLKFTGDCNIAGTINTSGAGGTGGAKSTAGNLGARAILGSGQPSTGTNHITGGIGGSGGLYGYFDISNGSGGAGGSDGPWYSGGAPGGNGGQSVAIICKGTLTISGTINASGGAGTDAQNSPSSNTIDGGGSGGGGGGSGNILLVANAFSITAPTLNVNGGAAGYPSRALGGNGGSFPNTWTPGGAGGGASGKNAGSNGSNGNASCVCTGGNSGAGAVGSVFYCRYDSFYNLGF